QGPPVGHSFGSVLIAEQGPPAASRSATRRAAGERSSARNKGAKRPRAEVLGGAGGAAACAQGAAAMMERQERAEKHIRSRRPAGRRPCARARSVAGGPGCARGGGPSPTADLGRSGEDEGPGRDAIGARGPGAALLPPAVSVGMPPFRRTPIAANSTVRADGGHCCAGA